MSSKFMLELGGLLAIGMIVWGVSGMFRGSVLTKSYGTVDGERRYYRFVRRDEEPVWFWTLCGIYTGIGIAMLALILVLHRMPAFSG